MPLPQTLPPARRARRARRARARVARLVLPVLLVAALAWAGQGLIEARAAAGWQPATELDPVLVSRFRAAQAAAAAQGVVVDVTSGLRSPDEQQALVDAEVVRRGSEHEAHRWVAPVRGSAHVRGEALDLGPADGAAWVVAHGAEFGLCQVFANEPWHVEALVEPGGTCPPVVEDASGLW